LEEAKRDLTKVEQTLTQAPAPFENDMELLPLLRGDTFIEYGARQFACTPAAPLEFYKKREQRLNALTWLAKHWLFFSKSEARGKRESIHGYSRSTNKKSRFLSF